MRDNIRIYQAGDALDEIEKELRTKPALKQIFEQYAAETITEEQIGNVLAPVLQNIEQGKYDRPRSKAVAWLIGPAAAAVAVAALIVGVAFFPNRTAGDNNVVITGALVPLAEPEDLIGFDAPETTDGDSSSEELQDSDFLPADDVDTQNNVDADIPISGLRIP